MRLKTRAALALAGLIATGVAAAAPPLPRYEPDPYWPKHLPNSWMLGQVSGVTVDSHDHIWVIHRPRTTEEHDNYLRDKTADCCAPAPPVLEFDQAGNLVQSWGGPGQGYDWPDTEHGIFVDTEDNVWITGNGAGTAWASSRTSTALRPTRRGISISARWIPRAVRTVGTTKE